MVRPALQGKVDTMAVKEQCFHSPNKESSLGARSQCIWPNSLTPTSSGLRPLRAPTPVKFKGVQALSPSFEHYPRSSLQLYTNPPLLLFLSNDKCLIV